MAVYESGFTPKLSFLSAEDKARIHRAVLEVLSEIGMKILHAEARALLQDAGCRVIQDEMVCDARQVRVTKRGPSCDGSWRPSFIFRDRFGSYLFTGFKGYDTPAVRAG